MELKATLVAVSDDARSWLKTWARDFTDAETVQPRADPRAPNPLAWQLGHLACVEDEVAQLFTTGKPGHSLVEPALRADRGHQVSPGGRALEAARPNP